MEGLKKYLYEILYLFSSTKRLAALNVKIIIVHFA